MTAASMSERIHEIEAEYPFFIAAEECISPGSVADRGLGCCRGLAVAFGIYFLLTVAILFTVALWRYL